MHLTPQAQAVMLLTVAFGKADGPGTRPLTIREWARFAIWLKDHGLEPASLLAGDVPKLLSGWLDRSISVDRVQALLGRGAALAIALERWQRAGLWVLTRADPDYPERLKRRLRLESPPVLFGCGNRSLLNRGGIAVVGSRDAGEGDLAFSAQLGGQAAAEGQSIVSGGARGVDQAAMLGALEREGTAVGVLADSLLRSSTSPQFRPRILSGDLALITPFNPEAGFNVGHAMARNRYIYCLSDVAVVVSSTAGEGGTWSGAIEDLEAGWVPLWVRAASDPKSGNAELAKRGAHILADQPLSLRALLEGCVAPPGAESTPELPLLGMVSVSNDARSAEATRAAEDDAVARRAHRADDAAASPGKPNGAGAAPDFYALFLQRLGELTAGTAMPSEEIAASLALEKAQVAAWLKRGVAERRIQKQVKPTRYKLTMAGDGQASLFGAP